MPKVQEMVKEIFSKEPHKGINPDEVVASGAAIQAGVLVGDVKDLLLLDVTPLSFGIETLGGVMTTLIPRNTTIPTKKSETFTTAADSQTNVEVHVLQGERSMASDNRSLGRFILEGIPAAPRGVPQIEVSFDIDANGILHVAAKDKGTGKERKIRIESSSGLEKDEVENLVKNAESHAEEDKKKKELIEAKNELDGLIYSTEKSLKEHGDKVSEEERKNLQESLDLAKQKVNSENVSDIKEAKENLLKSSHKLAEEIYKKTTQDAAQDQASPEGPSEPTEEEEGKPKSGGDDVIDAEYKEE